MSEMGYRKKKMGRPAREMARRHIQLGRNVRKTLRGRRKYQWVDVKQISEAPQICDYVGEIARGAIDNAAQYVNRNRAQHEKKIEQDINADASPEYAKSNSEHCDEPRRSQWDYRDIENWRRESAIAEDTDGHLTLQNSIVPRA